MRRAASAAFRMVAVIWSTATFAQVAPKNFRGPAEIERALAKQPSAEAYNALGAWFAQRDQIACAIPAFQSAIRLSPGSWDGHFNLALALMDERHFQQAISELRQADKLGPGRAPVHRALGIALQDSGQLPAAEAELKSALEIDSHSVPALDRMAQVLTAEKRFSAATRYLKEAISLDPKDPNLRISLALNCYENGNANEAIETLSRLAKDEPGSALVHFNLATVYAREKLFRQAADEYRESVRLDPANDVARLSLVKALVDLAEFDEALPLIQDYAGRKPEEFEAHYLFGSVYRGLGPYEAAERELKRAVQMDPNHYDVRYNLGFVLRKESKPAEALPHLQKALELHPDSSEVRFRLANVLRALKQTEAARAELKQFETEKQQGVQENQAAVKASTANRLLEDGDARGAVQAYQEALKFEPNSANIYYNLALAQEPTHTDAQYLLGQDLAKLGKESGAIAHWRKAVELNPEHAEALYNLARRLSKTGPAEAKQYEERFAELQRRRRITERADTLGNFALAAASARDWNQAVAQLEEAVQICGNCQSKGDLHKNLGLIYCRSGRLEKGEHELRIAKGLKQDDPDVKKPLEMIAELKNGNLKR
jgi:tetratricopeptide (TPR) repeat protein